MPNEKQAGGSDKSTDEKREDAAVKKMPKASVDGDLVRVIEKIQGAESILVALSKDPTLDEIAAALGLTMALDNMGKHVTAIYSGKTPSVLEFLQPEKTFETNTNSLQDFIISLSKDKADHLRYKIEGDFVRVYITPYRTTIDKNDLEFSHGEVNVDLIISLNVTEMGDFDAALAKHGRIMHDASAINISNTVPGRLGGVEWNRTSASSVSEMIVTMLKEMEQPMTEDIATALLTGIEAETERFSNEKTTPEAMTLAAKLMEAGANQQLIVANIMRPEKKEEPEKKEDEVEPGSVEVNDEENAAEEKSDVAEEKKDGVSEEGKDDSSEEKKDDVNEEDSPEKQLEKMIIGGKKEESNAMKELSVMGGEGETATEQAVEIPKEEKMENKLMAAVPTVEVPVESVYGSGADRTNLNDKTVEPLNIEKPKDFGAMMEEALAEPVTNPAIQAAPAVQTGVEGAVPTASSDGQDLSNMVNQMVANAQQQPVQMMQTVPEQTLEPVQPMQAAPEQTLEPVQPSQAVPEQALEPVQPSQGIELPPPPAPMPINGMMPPEMPSLPPVQPQQVTPVAPTETVPQMSPVQPLMPAQQMSPVQPLMPAQQMSPVQPPAPIDESAAEGVSVAPDGTTMAQPEQPVNPVVVQPELNQNSEGNDNSSNSSQPVQDPTLVPPVQDPGAFKIPGM